jgi:hypothetical protein
VGQSPRTPGARNNGKGVRHLDASRRGRAGQQNGCSPVQHQSVAWDFNPAKELYCGQGSFGADDGLLTLSTCTISVPADSLFA